jgi:hypothetical protein
MYLGNALTLISGAIFEKWFIDMAWCNRMDAQPCLCMVYDGRFGEANNTMFGGNIFGATRPAKKLLMPI